MTFGLRLQNTIDWLGLKPAELARRSGVTPGHISAILKGKKPNPRLNTIRRISYALGLTVSEIVGDDSSLLEFARSSNLSYDEYLDLLETTLSTLKPTSVSGWKEKHEELLVSKYPGLAAYLKRANMKWSDIQPYIEQLPKNELPNDIEGWERFIAWQKAFRLERE